jgi:hypothetical protein
MSAMGIYVYLQLFSYQAELSSLLALLYMLHEISRYYNIDNKKVIIYCDNKGALNNTYHQPKLGLTPFFNTDYDLLEVAYDLLSQTPLALESTWVKGHYIGKRQEFKHTLNDLADELATSHHDSHASQQTSRKPISPPNYKVYILHDNSVITGKFYATISAVIHDGPLTQHVMRKTGWSASTFFLNDWGVPRKGLSKENSTSSMSLIKVNSWTSQH